MEKVAEKVMEKVVGEISYDLLHRPLSINPI